MGVFGRLKLVGIAVVLLGGAVGGAFALGALGVPSVAAVDNRFTGISTDTTTVETGLTVSNPNPVGVQLGGTSVDYTVSMNDVAMASGAKEGIAVGTGNSTLDVTTEMRNDRIPAWWASHVRNGETTRVSVDANVTSSLLGGRSVSLSQGRTVETNVVGQFNSTETRPVEAGQPFVSDPVLYVNETRGAWDRANVTGAETPMDLAFDVYNPKPYPYTVSRIGYEVRMNDVAVGSGATERGAVIAPGETETVRVDTAIRNQRLDEWWVSHLQRNQETALYIDFYLVVDAAGEQFRIDVDAIDYETTIETDIFGNKAQYPTGTDASSDSSGETTDSGSSESTETDDSTPTDDGVLGGATDDGLFGGSETQTETTTETADGSTTPADDSTPTPTETDGGLVGGTL